MDITTLGIDIAKSIFQLHGIDADGAVVVQKKIWWGAVLNFLGKVGPCLIGMEACATSHYWAREIAALGHEVRLSHRPMWNTTSNARRMMLQMPRRFARLSPDLTCVLFQSRPRNNRAFLSYTGPAISWCASAPWSSMPSGDIWPSSGSSRRKARVRSWVWSRDCGTTVMPACRRLRGLPFLRWELILMPWPVRSEPWSANSWSGTGRIRRASGSKRFQVWVSSPPPPWQPACLIRRSSNLVGSLRPSSGWYHDRTHPVAKTASDEYRKWEIGICENFWWSGQPRWSEELGATLKKPAPGCDRWWNTNPQGSLRWRWPTRQRVSHGQSWHAAKPIAPHQSPELIRTAAATRCRHDMQGQMWMMMIERNRNRDTPRCCQGFKAR